MKILKDTIRKMQGREDYRLTLVWKNAKGITRMVSVIKDTRKLAQNERAFRLAGLNNGGMK